MDGKKTECLVHVFSEPIHFLSTEWIMTTDGSFPVKMKFNLFPYSEWIWPDEKEILNEYDRIDSPSLLPLPRNAELQTLTTVSSHTESFSVFVLSITIWSLSNNRNGGFLRQGEKERGRRMKEGKNEQVRKNCREKQRKIRLNGNHERSLMP